MGSARRGVVGARPGAAAVLFLRDASGQWCRVMEMLNSMERQHDPLRRVCPACGNQTGVVDDCARCGGTGSVS